MELNTVVTLISNLGFAIVAAGAMFWKNNEDDKRHKAEIDSLIQLHREEVDGLKDALYNNSLIITELKVKLEGWFNVKD